MFLMMKIYKKTQKKQNICLLMLTNDIFNILAIMTILMQQPLITI